MSTEVKFRRGTTAQHTSFTGADGEMTVDQTKKVVVIHDAVTAGGFPGMRGDTKLNNIPLANGPINLNGQLAVNGATPVSPTDLTTKSYVDAAAVGLDIKSSVRAIATSNITLSGVQVIDGVAVIVGNRVLAVGQTAGASNGIYVVAAGAWARSSDANTSAQVTSGMFTFVSEGTANASTGWVLVTPDPIVLDTTSLSFTQFTGLGEVIAGAGLTKTGNTIDVIANADGSIVVNPDDLKVGVLATDAQHGNRGGGTVHAAVIASGAAGFMTGADKAKLDGVSAGAAVSAVTATSPVASSGGAAPNITLLDGTVTDVKIAAANKDGAAATPSMRTLGSGAAQAMPGNASPNAHAGTHYPGPGGTNTDPIPAASSTQTGLMLAADKAKLDGYPAAPGLRQTVEGSGAGATASNIFTNLMNLAITTVAGSKLIVDFSAGFRNAATIATTVLLRVRVDGLLINGTVAGQGVATVLAAGIDSPGNASLALELTGLAAGAHTVNVDWKTFVATTQSVICQPTVAPDQDHCHLRLMEVTV